MLDYAQISALGAVIRTGSFDQAAAALNVTPSAISQRIKLLEDQLGAVLIVRGQPATGTPAGQRLFRHFEETCLLESTLAHDLKGLLGQPAAAPIRVAVNADSLDTWFISAMAKTDGILFDLTVDDQDHSADWLKRGEVLAAITAHQKPVQGCESIALGALRYVATASPEFAARYFPDGLTCDTAKHAPMLMFNRKDLSQNKWLSCEFEQRITPPIHLLPSTRGFVEAAVLGLGWGLNPQKLVQAHLNEGRLVLLGENPVYDVPLFWQFNRVTKSALALLTKAVVAGAQTWLV